LKNQRNISNLLGPLRSRTWRRYIPTTRRKLTTQLRELIIHNKRFMCFYNHIGWQVGHNTADCQQNVRKYFKYRWCCHAVTANENSHTSGIIMSNDSWSNVGNLRITKLCGALAKESNNTFSVYSLATYHCHEHKNTENVPWKRNNACHLYPWDKLLTTIRITL
jgi:hypothetical protein